MDGMIFAAGLGTRLQPLTDDPQGFSGVGGKAFVGACYR